MDEIEYASRYLGEYKIKGDEIVPLLCPFCGGGSHRDKETFALNRVNHTYNCKRGSCGVSGHFSELLRDKGEIFVSDTPSTAYIKPKHNYKAPETSVGTLTDAAIKYLTARGIALKTAVEFAVGCDERGNMVFPYYKTADDRNNGRPTFIKFRKPEKIKSGRKMWREFDTMPILYNLQNCDPQKSGGILYITEGEFDAMALWQATGGNLNVTSVPSGAEDFTWVETCADILEEYKYIAVIGDNDPPGLKMAQDIVTKLSGGKTKVLLPDYTTYRGCKDANEILLRWGNEAFLEIIAKVKQPPVKGLIDISCVRRSSVENIRKTRTGLQTFDKTIGGFFEGDATVWTGRRGSGKSTLLNQLMLQAVEDGENVCVYSGEVPADRLKDQIYLCAAGYLHTDERVDRLTGRTFYAVSHDVEPYIDDWLRGRIWFYDNKIIEKDERDAIIERFTAAYKQYDCRVFVVDNLMTVNCNANARDVMQIQAEFVIRLRKFAALYNSHVHIVVHPRKTNEINDADDVGGMGTITNIANNVFAVKRKGVENDDKVTITCHKNRAFGALGDMEFTFDSRSRRFGEAYTAPTKFGWEYIYETAQRKDKNNEGCNNERKQQTD